MRPNHVHIMVILLVSLGISISLLGCTAPPDGEVATPPAASQTAALPYPMALRVTSSAATATILPSPTLPAVDPNQSLPTPFPITTAAPGTSQRLAITKYAQGNTDIYLINPDGSDAVNLTNHPESDFGVSWSPDGRQIAFASTRDGNAEIYIMRADGTQPQRLTERPERDVAPIWSPDGQRIAFMDLHSEPLGTIYVMTADGSNLTQLATGIRPVWSSDGTRLLFSNSIQSDAEIHLINADGSNARYLVNGNNPTWSLDGTQILFDYNAQVYTINVNGTDLTTLADGIEPTWSPDGSQIAFVSFANASRALAIMDANGDNLRDLTVGEVNAPRWSPDGQMIAFRRGGATGIGGGAIRIIHVDDGTEYGMGDYGRGRGIAFAWKP